MITQRDITGCERRRNSAVSRGLVLLVLALSTGCAALHPIKGVPASYLPPEYMGPSRDGLRPINPMLLTRARPPEHLVDGGDVLSIYIPSVLGVKSAGLDSAGDTPPINYPSDPEMPPTVGYPITVRDDGTISLPQIPPLPVRGMTISQVEQAIRQAYTVPKQIINVDSQRIVVSLQRIREHRVLVVREDSSLVSTQTSGIGTVNLGSTRRGTARIVSLKAYENDVLHALARVQGADGLPGLDAEGAIYVIRRQPRNAGYMSPMGCGPQTPYLGAARPAYATVPMTQQTSGFQPVIRYQSPSGDYRSHSASGYSGHSFSSPSSGLNSSGRYGTTAAAAANGTLPRTPPTSTGRYGAGPGGSGYSMNAGQLSAMQPAASNWTAAAPPSARPSPSGHYGQSPIQLTQGFSGDSAAYALPNPWPPQGTWNGAGGSSGLSPEYAAPINTSPPPQPAMMQPAPMMEPIPAQVPSMAPLAPPMPMSPAQGYNFGYGALPTDDYFQSMMATGLDGTIDGPNVTRIPIRVGPGETPHIAEQDITLEDGDIVFIEARGSEVFYTGGLLGGGQFTLPRDYDLRALEALSIAQSQGTRGGNSRSAGGVSALNQDVTISASKLIVVRKLADGTSVPIEVDLNRAKQDMTGRENIIIQPGDYLYLQYSCIEAVGAFFERHLLEGALFGLATAQFTSGGN